MIFLDLLGVIVTLINLAIFIIHVLAIYYIMHPDEYYKWLFEEGVALNQLYELLKAVF